MSSLSEVMSEVVDNIIYFSVNLCTFCHLCYDVHEIIQFWHEFWNLWDALLTFNNDGIQADRVGLDPSPDSSHTSEQSGTDT